MTNQSAIEKLNLLRDDYKNKFPIKLHEIAVLWKKISENFDREDFKKFHRLMHHLCGASGTYGYDDIYHHARNLEVYVKALLTHETISPEQQNEIQFLLKNLSKAKLTIKLTENIKSVEIPKEKRILSYRLPEETAETMQKEMEAISYFFTIIASFEELQLVLKNKTACYLLIDAQKVTLSELGWLKEYRKNHDTVYIYIGRENDIHQRLNAVRGSGDIFFDPESKILTIRELVSRYSEALSEKIYRVLVLDDEKDLAQYYAMVIEEAGMIAKAMSDPMKLLTQLNEFNPDLLLLDLYMPQCSGLELAMILRQTEHYFNLPIIFISSEEDHAKQVNTLMTSGADLFLIKPILPEYLVSSIRFRLRYGIIQNAMIRIDRLTGLLTHVYFMQMLEFEYARMRRFEQNLCVAMIDLDFFKKVNDTYGHIVGDIVIQKTADLIHHRLRKTDHIGRYGGEEFSVIFPKTSLEQCKKICDDLCQMISENIIYYEQHHIQITISIGVASSSTGFLSEKEILVAADQALYEAKKSGRNCTVVFQKLEGLHHEK